MNRYRGFIMGALLVLVPSTAWANAGTPLMWNTALHMFFGNAIIGAFEGFFLASIFRVSWFKPVFVLIAANYFSAWIGAWLIMNGMSLKEMTIESLYPGLLWNLLILFVLTIVLELPFFWFAVRTKGKSLARIIKAGVLIHVASYSILVLLYCTFGGVTLGWKFAVVPPSQMEVNDACSIYYLSPQGDEVLRIQLGKSADPETIAKLPAAGDDDRLIVKQGVAGQFDLYVRQSIDAQEEVKELLVIKAFASKASVDPVMTGEHTWNTWFNFGEVPNLSDSSEWRFRTGFWSAEGILCSEEKTEKSLSFSVETHFVDWAIRNAIQIDGSHVIFQLGDDQICILNPDSKKISLLARGKGPVVALDSDP